MADKKGQGGFTLVELLVTILAGSMIAFAALTIILLGMRVHGQSTDAVRQQHTVRVVLEMLEDLAAEGTITGVSTDHNAWEIRGEKTDDEEQGERLLWYDPVKGTISGRSGTILEEVIASHVILNGKLLTFALETPAGSYTTSVYCRMAVAAPDAGTAQTLIADLLNKDGVPEGSLLEGVTGARLDFLKVLATQYKRADGMPNTGTILEDGIPGDYYTQWYLGGTFQGDWNKDTPWCACFVSWGLNEVRGSIGNNPADRFVSSGGSGYYKWYANVDEFWGYFGSPVKTEGQIPDPGDIVFFDWEVDETGNPQHVGVVLTEKDGVIYTIEGNSAGMVALGSYEIDDGRILGYGQVSWN